MQKGTLGKLGQPSRVLGVDINPNMVEHCRQITHKKIQIENALESILNLQTMAEHCSYNPRIYIKANIQNTF